MHNKLKNSNEKNETKYINCHKNLFGAIKKRSKRNHFSKLIRTCKNNITKTWEIMKESIGKGKCNNQSFPRKVVIDNIAIKDEQQNY